MWAVPSSSIIYRSGTSVPPDDRSVGTLGIIPVFVAFSVQYCRDLVLEYRYLLIRGNGTPHPPSPRKKSATSCRVTTRVGLLARKPHSPYRNRACHTIKWLGRPRSWIKGKCVLYIFRFRVYNIVYIYKNSMLVGVCAKLPPPAASKSV